MNEIVSLLRSFHTRLDGLETQMKGIFDVQIPISDIGVKDVISITCRISKHVGDDLVQYLQKNQVTNANVFSSPHFKKKNGWSFTSAVLTDEILFRERSNGQKCKLVVCKGLLKGPGMSQTIEAALKFRQVESENLHFSEQEAGHALHIDRNEKVRIMFPEFYCMFQVLVKKNESYQLWECIASELLDEIPQTLIYSDPVSMYLPAFRLLQKMHTLGYIHSDAHSGNFMLRPSTGNMLMIDQDEIMQISSEPTVAKFMQIMDYWMLLYHNNPYIRFLRHVPSADPAINAVFKGYSKMRALFPPYGYTWYRDWSDQDTQQYLSREAATHPVTKMTYWDYLKSVKITDIDAEFEKAFSSKRYMEYIQEIAVFALNREKKPNDRRPPARQEDYGSNDILV